MNFIVISLKKNFLTIIFLSFIACLLIFSNSNLNAAQNGILLWANSVLPTLFPFFIATELLYKTNFVTILGTLLTKFMRPIFNIPGESAIAVLLGNISGYPIGAKLACNLKENKICTKIEAERIISFTNNSGPLFILGTIGVSMFCNREIGLLLLATHFLSSITVGIIFRYWKKNKQTLYNKVSKNLKNESNISVLNLGEILGDSIKNSINLVLTIGGFIVLFSVIISILEKIGIIDNISNFLNLFGLPKEHSKAILYGFLELTNGLQISSSLQAKDLSTNIIISAFILGFGGISVLLQVYSIISKHGISIKPYLYGKILQAFISAFYTFLALQAFPFLAFPI